MEYVQQLLEELRLRNFDDRGAKLGDRQRDKACAALEGMTLTKDRFVLKGSLANLPRTTLFLS